MATAGSLGEISVTFTANLKVWNNQLRQLQKSFAKSIKKINGETDKMAANFKGAGDKMKNAFKGVGKNAKKETSKIKKEVGGLGKFLQTFSGQIQHYLTFTIGVQAVMQTKMAIQSLIETTINFERAATNATSVAGYLGAAFDKMREHIMDVSIELGRTTIFTASSAADAFYNLASAGWDVGEITKNEMIPILNYAAATQSELEDATYAVSTSLKQFNMTMEETSRVADVMTATITNTYATAEKLQHGLRYVGAMAGTLGMEFEEVNAALGVLYNRGLQGGQAGQRLNMILAKLLKPTEKGKRAIRALGVSVEEINPQMNSLTDILYRLQAAQFSAAEGAAFFRARTAAAAVQLVDNVDEVARLTEEVRYAGGVSESVAEKQIDTLYGAFTLLKSATEAAGLAAKDFLVPALSTIAKALRDYVVPALESVSSTLVYIGDAFSSVGEYGKAVAGMLITVGISAAALAVSFKAVSAIAPVLAQGFFAAAFGGTALHTVMIGILQTAMMMASGLMIVNIAGDKFTDTQKKALTVASALLPILYLIHKARVMNFILKQKDLVIDKARMALKSAFMGLEKQGLILSATGNALQAAKAKILDRLIAKQAYLGIYKRNYNALQKKGLLLTTLEYAQLKIKVAWEKIEIKTILTKIALKIKDTAITIGKVIATGLEIAAKAALAVVNLILAGTSIALQIAMGPIGWIMLAIAGAAGVLIGLFGDASNITGTLAGAFGWLKDVLMIVGKVIVAIFLTPIIMLKNAVVAVFKALVSLGEYLSDVFKPAIDAVGSAVDTLIGWIGAAADAIGGFIDTVMDIPILGDVLGFVADAATEAAIAVGLISDESDKMSKNQKAIADEMMSFNIALQNYETAAKELLSVERKWGDQLETNAQAVEEYTNAESELSEAERQLSSQTKVLLDGIRNFSEGLDEAIGYQEDIADVTNNYADKKEDLAEITREVTRLEQEASQAVAEFGANSEVATDAIKSLNIKVKERAKLSQELGKLDSKRKAIEIELKKATEELSASDRAWLSFTQDLISEREKFVDLKIREAQVSAKLEGYTILLAEADKIYQEKERALLETTEKLYEAELKLYKLRKDTPNKIREVWEALAQQGLISGEMVEGRREMEAAQGELIKSQIKYGKVVEGLNNEQQESMADFMEAYNGYLDENMTAQEAWAAAMQDIDISQFLGSQQIGYVQDYTDAVYDAKTTTGDLAEILVPYAQNLYESGVISAEAAEALTDWVTQGNEAAQTTNDIAQAQTEYRESIEDVIGFVSNLARAHQDEADELDSVRSVIPDMVDDMTLWEEELAEGADATKLLMKFMGVTEDEFENLSDESIIAALSIAQVADSMGLLEGKTLEDVIGDTDIPSMEYFTTQAESSLGDMEDTFLSLDDTLQQLTGSLDDWANSMDRILTQFFRESGLTEKDYFENIMGDPDQIADYVNNWEGQMDDLIEAMMDAGLSGKDALNLLMDAPQGEGFRGGWEDNMDSLLDYFDENYPEFNVYQEVGPEAFAESWTGSLESFLDFMAIHQQDFGVNMTDLLNQHEFMTSLNSIEGDTKETINGLESWLQQEDNRLTLILEAPNKVDTVFAINKLISDINSGDLDKIFVEIVPVYPDAGDDESFWWLHDPGSNWPPPGMAKGGIANFTGSLQKFANGISMVSSPTIAMIGEDGAEAVVPLENNRDNGLAILSSIIPNYFPEMMMQTGALSTSLSAPSFGGVNTRDIITVSPSGRSSTYNEEYNFYGDFNISGIQNAEDMVEEFMDELKKRKRMRV